MAVSSFQFLSVHDYCARVGRITDVLSTRNSIYRPAGDSPSEPRAPEFIDEADRHAVAPLISRERNRDQFGVGFDASQDLFFARLDDVIVERSTRLGSECFRIFVDRGVALSEPYNAHYKADWPLHRYPDRVAISVNGQTLPVYLHDEVEPEVTIDDPIVHMMDKHAGNYYHWMTEVAPRLWAHREVPELARVMLAVNEPALARFQRESLGALLGAAGLMAFPWKAARFRRLYLPSFVSFGEYTPRLRPWFSDLRSRFGPRPPVGERRRLYVSRKDSTSRRIINDDAVADALRPLGFEQIALSDLSLAEQIDHFASAEAVVLPHGAAGANLAASAPGTVVIECQSPALLNPTVWQAAHMLDQRYGLVLSEGMVGGHPDYQSDITVDVPKLQRVVHTALKASR